MMNAYEKAKQLTAKWEQERKDSKRLARGVSFGSQLGFESPAFN